MSYTLVSAETNKPIVVEQRMLFLGSDEQCDIVISGEDVAPRHCCLVKSDDGVAACDLASSDGVRVNDQRVVGRRMLQPGDRLTVAGASFTFKDGKPARSQTLALSVAELAAYATGRRKSEASPARTPRRLQPGELPEDAELRPSDGIVVERESENAERAFRGDDEPEDRPARRGRRNRGRSSDDERRDRTPTVKPRDALVRRRPGPTRFTELRSLVERERRAGHVDVVDVTCSKCKHKFCQVAGEAGQETAVCPKCASSQHVTARPSSNAPSSGRTPMSARQAAAQHLATALGGLESIAKVGAFATFILMAHFTLLACCGFGEFAEVVGASFIPFVEDHLQSETSVPAAIMLMLLYGAAPLAVLLTIHHVADDLRSRAMWGALAGAGLSVIVWPFRPPTVALIQIGALVLLFVTCLLLPGCLALASPRGGSRLEARAGGAAAAFAVSSLLMIVAAATQFGGEMRLAVVQSFWGILSGILVVWFIGEALLLSAFGAISEMFHEEEVITCLWQHLAYVVITGALAVGMLLVLFTQNVSEEVIRTLSLLFGTLSTINFVWFFQLSRFTHYVLRQTSIGRR